jgi:hypothetical protein
MDNLPAHKLLDIRQAIDRTDAALRFLRTSSLKPNSIDVIFSWFKVFFKNRRPNHR